MKRFVPYFIVAAVVAMAHALDLWVVAEGIETRTQLDLLRSYGVTRGQGYLFARPMPALEVEWWTQERELELFAG